MNKTTKILAIIAGLVLIKRVVKRKESLSLSIDVRELEGNFEEFEKSFK